MPAFPPDRTNPPRRPKHGISDTPGATVTHTDIETVARECGDRIRVDGNEAAIYIDHDDFGYYLSSREAIQFHNTILHEIGHAIGIGHSDVERQVMSGGVENNQGDTRYWHTSYRQSPQPDDIAAAQKLYGGVQRRENGTNDSDTLDGTNGDDLIRGYGGNDFIDGFRGNDRVEAGSGNDFVWGAKATIPCWGTMAATTCRAGQVEIPSTEGTEATLYGEEKATTS